MIRAVLFDLDGTLADSLNDLAASTNYALGVAGYPPQPKENFRYYAGDGIAKMIERALPEAARSSDIINSVKMDFSAHYSVHYNDATCSYPGIDELLDSLSGSGILTAVVTNKAQPFAEKVVHKLFGTERFNIINGQREGIPTKPDPTLALMTMRELGVTPGECVFLGDTGMDVATGVNSGAYPVGELWGFRGEKELLENGARSIIRTPLELLDVIRELNK